MPQKNGNLAYNPNIPSFLANLQNQVAGHDAGPARSTNRRLGKTRSASEEAEDAPVIVDEDGNATTLTMDKSGNIATEEGEKTTAEKSSEKEEDGQEDGAQTKTAAKATSATSIGGRKKRTAKMVAGDDEDDEDGTEKEKEKGKGKDADLRGGAGEKKGDEDKNDGKRTKKRVKGNKKIQLSFADED